MHCIAYRFDFFVVGIVVVSLYKHENCVYVNVSVRRIVSIC